MFLEHDGDENHEPVTHEGEKILENGEEVVPARDGADEIDCYYDADPKIAGYGFTVAAENLTAQGCCIGARDVIGDYAESNDDGAEFPKSAQTTKAGQDKRSRGDIVRVGPFWGSGDAAAQTNTQESDENEREGETGEGHEESELFVGVFGVIDIEVGSCASP